MSHAAAWSAAPPPAPAEPESLWSAWSRTVDHASVGMALALFAIGVVLSFAASPALAEDNNLEPFHYAWRQLGFGLPAFGALFLLSFFGPSGVRRFGTVVALVGLAALIVVLLKGVDFGKGAQRWLSFGGMSFQPSEFAKPGLVIVSAWMLSAMGAKDPAVRATGAAASFALIALAIGLLIAQPDYGQAALLAAVWGAMFFVAGAPLLLLLALGLACAAVGWVAYVAEPHVAARIDAFLDPAANAGRQLQVAEQAVVNGGWTGRGLGEGVAKAHLPDAHADFIIAVAAEEYGFVLCAAVVALFAFFTLRQLWRLRNVEDVFVRLAGLGLTLLLGLQALVNLAVAVQLAPAKGMRLPFISYGGSALLASGLTVGLLLALTRTEGRASPEPD